MSFLLNSSEQFGFMDRLSMLTDRDKRRLEKSRAKVFADEVFPYIDESKYSVLYSTNPASWPNTPVNVIIGGLIIRELFNYSDEAFVEASSLDIRIAYALHTQGFTEQPFSDRTFSRFRERCFRYEQETGRDLLKETFTELSDHIAKLMNINKQLSRMDSMMINANIKKLSRLELLYRYNANLARAIFKADEKLLKEILYHYLDPDDYNRLFYYQKSEDSKETEKKLCNESGLLLHAGKDLLSDQKEYLDLKRALEEQTVKENGTRRFKTGQDEKMNSTVLQNPSDPDATYREKAGNRYIGYAANFEESVGENGSVITDHDFEPSDKKFIQDNISRKERSTEKSTMIVDGGYSSVEVINKAKEKNIDIIATNLAGRDTPEVYADFELSEDGKRVIHCANGCTPKKSSYNAKAQQCTASFLKEQCINCPFRDQCHPKFYKKAARV